MTIKADRGFVIPAFNTTNIDYEACAHRLRDSILRHHAIDITILTIDDLPETDLTIALKPMTNFDRYGVVNIDEENNITSFSEKEARVAGNINGGIYALRTACLKEFIFPAKFSFEKDFMESHVNMLYFKGYTYQDYFIDIGIPEDYATANEILPANY